jgi:citrate synthase
MLKVTGLEGVVAAETEISLVDGEKGHLVYRGHWAKDLAVHYTFEEVAYLLLYGNMPMSEELANFKKALTEKRKLPAHAKTVLDSLPNDMEMMSVLRTVISAMGTTEYGWEPTIEQAIEVTAVIPTIITFRFHQLNNREPVKPNDEYDHVTNYLYMLTGEEPSEAHIKALSAYMILTMEHGMNASTFSGRVVLSTQSDLISAVTGAIGAMKGPLHGGAPSEVIALLDDIHTKENAEPWIRKELEAGRRLMGFGHRVYKTYDPRSVALKTVAQELSGKDPWLDLALHVEETAIRLLDEYKPGRKLYSNVEFYAAAVLRAVEMPSELYTPTFTASRIIGWTAHILEQAQHNRIFRPKATYVGEMPNN